MLGDGGVLGACCDCRAVCCLALLRGAGCCVVDGAIEAGGWQRLLAPCRAPKQAGGTSSAHGQNCMCQLMQEHPAKSSDSTWHGSSV
jgi:hypothetical protein